MSKILKKVFNKESIMVMLIFLLSGIIFSGIVWNVNFLYWIFNNWNLEVFKISTLGLVAISLIVFLVVKKSMKPNYRYLAFIFLTIIFIIGMNIGTKFIFADGPRDKICESEEKFSERALCYTDLALKNNNPKYCNSITTWAFTTILNNNQDPLIGRDFCYESIAIQQHNLKYCKRAIYYGDCTSKV